MDEGNTPEDLDDARHNPPVHPNGHESPRDFTDNQRPAVMRKQEQLPPGTVAEDPESNEYLRTEEDFELENVEPSNATDQISPQNEDTADVSPPCSSAEHARHSPSLRRITTSASNRNRGRFIRLRKLWRHHIAVAVPFKYCRDHLALERTFLGYIRTSIALSMIAILIAQLYPQKLEGGQPPSGGVSFERMAKPLSASLVVGSILIVICGAFRFEREQNAMIKGFIVTASWEVWGTGFVVLLVRCPISSSSSPLLTRKI